MGKISDALERHEKERAVQTEPLYRNRPEEPEAPPPPGSSTTRETSPTRESPDPSGFHKSLRLEDPELTRIRKAAAIRQFSPKLIVVSSPESVEAENFKALRARIQMASHEGIPPRTVLVTSTFPGEGKSFVASNLAASIAFGIDEHVLLVDCDLRQPQIHQYFGYAPGQGLSDYLTGRREIPDLLIKTDIPKLSILSAGTPPGNPAELLASHRMETFIEEVRNRYNDRYVVLDATPTQFTAEASVLARHVDGVLLVVMAGKTPRQAVQEGLNILPRERLLGVVFNGYSEPMKGYHKYYAGYYSKH